MEDWTKYFCDGFTHNCQPGCVCDDTQRLHEPLEGDQVDPATGADQPLEVNQPEADIQAQPADHSSCSMIPSACSLDLQAELEYELGRERRREARWLDEAVVLDTTSDESSDARPQKRRRTDSPTEYDQTREESTKRRRIAARWAVKPEHFDFEIDRPKLWVEDEDGDEVLTPWALKYFDRNPEELKAMERVYQDAYFDGKGSLRVTHFRMRPAAGPPPKLTPAREVLLKLRSKQAKKATGKRKARDRETPAVYTMRIGTLMQPVSGWMPLPEEGSDERFLLDYGYGNSAILSPPQSPQPVLPQSPQLQRSKAARDTAKRQPTSSVSVKRKPGMPIAYCFMEKRYRPKPWGNGERMPDGSHKADGGVQ